MGIRYNNRGKKINSDELYEEVLESRGKKQVQQYTTPSSSPITIEDRYSLINELHIWKIGDRLPKLASKYYGDPGLWWLISWYNQKPTEAHFKIGDTIAIPLPIDRALTLFNR
jgi:hypothetical protein